MFVAFGGTAHEHDALVVGAFVSSGAGSALEGVVFKFAIFLSLSLGGGQIAEVFGDEVDVGIFDVTHEEEGLVGSVAEAFAEDIVHAIEVEAGDVLFGRNGDGAGVAGTSDLDIFLDEGHLRVLADEFKLVAELVDVLVERLTVFAGSFVVEGEDLEHGFEVLGDAAAGEALSLSIDIGADGDVDTFEFLGELGAGELSDTGIVDEAGGIGGHVEFVVAIEGSATPSEGVHLDFVVLEVGFLDDEFHAIGAGVFLIVEDGVGFGEFGGDSGELFAVEGFVLVVVDPSSILGVAGAVVDGEDILLRGDTVAFLLGSSEVVDEVFFGDPGLDEVVALLKSDFGDEFLGIAVFGHDAGDYFTFEEVVGVFLSKIIAGGLVGFLGHFAVVFENLFFLAVELGLSETVLNGAEDFGEDGLGGILNAVFLGGAATDKGVATAA